MKKFKNKLLMIALFFISATGFSQVPGPVIYSIAAGTCINSDSGVNGYTVNNVSILTPPTLGTMTVAPVSGAFIYCAPGGMVGNDTARIYGCVMIPNATFPICDTVTIIFHIQSGCTSPFLIWVDSSGCGTNVDLCTVVHSGGTSPYSYAWSDGSTSNNVCLGAGQTVCVTVTDNNGCQSSSCVTSANSGCQFSVGLVQDSLMVCPGGNRGYNAVDNGGGISPFTYWWSDNSTASSACELNPGQGICVTVTDANGCSGSACSNNNGCQISVSVAYSATGCGVALPSLTASVTGGTPPYTYYWSNNATGQTICNLTTGIYYVDVVDAAGCSGVATYSIQGPGNCYFNYTVASNPLFPGVVNFTSQNDSAFTATSWLWTFGDGTADVAANPVHTFLNSSWGGYFYVTMNVYYSNGDSCSYSDYIYVPGDSINNYPVCQAYFYNYIDSANNSTFHFVDYSSYNPISWSWDFGDGTSSTLQNPTHTYNSLGTWTVCLTTADANGCSSNYCQQLSNIPVQDLEAYLFHQTTVTPGFPVWVYLSYYNAGTILVNGTVTYRYPVGTTVNATSLVPASHDVANRLLTFNVGNLLPGTSDNIMIDLDAGASLVLGTLAEDTMWINPIAGDATPLNNVSVVNDSVVGSWDPNDKAVSPKGDGVHGIVPVNTNEVSYRIRFQNTGSAPAQTVQIRDAISNNIDLTSVHATDASHAHTVEIIGNELVVSFAGINLPDSGANYAASQGYIYVHAKLKPGLANGTQIFNTADIYFDFNAPVITNTVVTTLGSFVSGIGETPNFDFAIMPNPASNQISLRGEFERGSTFELMNQLGQAVLKGEVNSNNTQVNIGDLSNGIYLVKITSGGKTGVRKLVVAK